MPPFALSCGSLRFPLGRGTLGPRNSAARLPERLDPAAFGHGRSEKRRRGWLRMGFECLTDLPRLQADRKDAPSEDPGHGRVEGCCHAQHRRRIQPIRSTKFLQGCPSARRPGWTAAVSLSSPPAFFCSLQGFSSRVQWCLPALQSRGSGLPQIAFPDRGSAPGRERLQRIACLCHESPYTCGRNVNSIGETRATWKSPIILRQEIPQAAAAVLPCQECVSRCRVVS